MDLAASALNPQQSSTHPHSSTFNPQLSTLVPQPSTLKLLMFARGVRIHGCGCMQGATQGTRRCPHAALRVRLRTRGRLE